MADILFITEGDIKNNSSVSNNLSPKLIMPYVSLAQDLYIKDVLGKDLFNEIIIQISGSTLTTENLALIDQIKKAMTYFSLYEALPFIRTRIEQTGIVFMINDTYQPVSDTTFFNLRKSVLNYAESYLETFKEWISDNKATYPLYKGCSSKGSSYDLCGLIF